MQIVKYLSQINENIIHIISYNIYDKFIMILLYYIKSILQYNNITEYYKI